MSFNFLLTMVTVQFILWVVCMSVCLRVCVWCSCIVTKCSNGFSRILIWGLPQRTATLRSGSAQR